MSVVVEESRAAGTAASAATSPAPPSAVPLHLVRRGSRARVRALSEERGAQLARRLADLGLEPGREVEVRRAAPMGDPTVYRVAGYEVSLRRRDASLVLVDVLDEGTDRLTLGERLRALHAIRASRD